MRLRKFTENNIHKAAERWLSTQEESFLLANSLYLKTLLQDHASDVSQNPYSQYLSIVDYGSDPFRLVEFFL